MSADAITNAPDQPSAGNVLHLPPTLNSSLPSGSAATAPSAAGLVGWVRDLARTDTPELSDDDRLVLISQLEDLQGAAWAAQARLSTEFETSQRAEQRANGVPAAKAGRAVSDDLATARRESPFAASNHLACARSLAEMPHTFEAAVAGDIKPWPATKITRITACLQPEDRAAVDQALAGKLAGLSDRQIEALAKAETYKADPQAYVNRGRIAAKDRRVSIKPAPDMMAVLSVFLPAKLAIAMYAALRKAALAAQARGDQRSLAQLMADIAYARITGDHAPGDDTATGPGPDIEIGLIMTDSSLIDGDPMPADLTGYGPIPADAARDLIHNTHRDTTNGGGHPASGGTTPGHPGGPADSSTSAGNGAHHARAPGTDRGNPDTDNDTRSGTGTDSDTGTDSETGSGTDSPDLREQARIWIRRLYTDPVTGQLIHRDTTRRLFTGALRDFIIARDQYCSTPWCGAPIRHIDHTVPYANGGATTPENGRGLCARCNLHKEHPRHTPTPDPLPPPEALPGIGRG